MNPGFIGLIGGVVGGIVGVAGGLLGTYFSIKNTKGPRERAFVIKLSIVVWIFGLAFGLAFVLGMCLIPGLYKLFLIPIYVVGLVASIPLLLLWNKKQAQIRFEESKKNPVVPSTQTIPRQCPQCGAELKPDVPEGLCPVCLLQRGIATEGGAPPGTPPFVPPGISELAKLFPQLEILELIGQGGMGAVYKARQPALDRLVALKILAPRSGSDADFAGRFAREARALAKLSHPNIVAVYDFGQIPRDATAGSPPSTFNPQPLSYFIMEYVDGLNLRQLERSGKLSPREALQIVPQICAALQFAHDEGIVHRDIKPENILLDKQGRVKIADFGLAKILGQEAKDFRLTGARDVMGTPHYMAPEQIEKPTTVDHRADIYSLGVVFYEMLTGELPLGKFQPPSSKVLIDVRLDEVVLHALEKEPSRRYQQVSEVKTQVETIAATPGSSPAGRDESAPSESQSRRTPAALRLPTTPFSRIVELAAEIGFYVSVLAVGSFIGFWMLRSALVYLGYPESKAPLYFSLCVLIFGIVSIVDQFFRLRRANLTLQEVFLRALEKGAARSSQQVTPAATKLPTTPFSRIINWTAVIFIGSWFLFVRFGYPMGSTFFHYYSLCFLIFALVASVEWFFRFRRRNFGLLKIMPAAAFVALLVILVSTQFNLFNLSGFVKSDYIGQSWFPKGDSIEITTVGRIQDRMVVKGRYNLVSADSATLALYVTTTNNVPVPTDPQQRMQISKGRGDFELIHSHLVPGLPHVSMYADGKSFAALYFGTKAEALEESKASWITNAPSASAETWSPTLAPGEKPDLQKILQEAKELANVGHYEEALQRHIWYHNHALEFDPAQTGVRLSFALGDWIDLGRLYPPAKQALMEIRDRDTRQFSEGHGDFKLFMDVHSINDYLGDDDATYALFKTIELQDKRLAQQCFPVAETLLVGKGEYDACLGYIGDPQAAFERIRQSWQQMKKFEEQNAARREQQTKRSQEMARTNAAFTNTPFLPEPPKLADKNFTSDTRQLIEILVATGHKTDAEKIRDEAVAVLDDVRLKSAVSDAEQKIEKRHATSSSAPLDGADQTVAGLPPVVVETFPVSGARDVEPGIAEIRVRFSKEMADGSWSWSTAWENSAPEIIGQPHYESDGRTCVAKVKLEPGRTYAWWLNSDKFKNFTDHAGRPAVPYLLIFQTKPN